MKTIPTEFDRKGWHFRQVFREGMVAVFERSRLPGLTQKHFETVKLRTHPAREAFGKLFDAGESYPSGEEWGSYGFTLPDETSAMSRARVLLERPVK